jgi:hypothetical protein
MIFSCLVFYNKVVVNFMIYLLLNFGNIWTYGLGFIAVQNWFSVLVALCLYRTDSVFAIVRPGKL